MLNDVLIALFSKLQTTIHGPYVIKHNVKGLIQIAMVMYLFNLDMVANASTREKSICGVVLYCGVDLSVMSQC